MGRDRSRSLEWGRANRPKISSKLGSPDPREGSDGDMQVRNTNVGAKLFAKLSGRWLSVNLEEDSSQAVSVKTHYFKFLMPSGETTVNIPLPTWINSGSVVGVKFFANHSTDLWHIYEWRSDAGSQAAVKHRVFYDRTQHRIEVDNMGTQIDDGKWANIIIFYR